MITVRKLRRVERGRELVDLALSSNDTKPTNVINGSKCIEVDTGESYVYDEENTAWNKISNGSGGGGGGSSDFSTAEVTVINNATNEFLLIIPNIFDDVLASELDSADIDPDTPLIVPLYTGRIEIGYPAISFDQENFSYVGSEGVSVNQFGKVIITGSGTLTITDANT